ncbi:hypothetical protein [Methylocucumis oryzae]|uniref:Uncharacterized protein n=1 Tax=Methylocucumis oryzae TaxID=1632867 RepID=A0A0F3ILX3_9GAMM|nr:hypothetical protein [Methylocucumis oryzae]KJV06544.1 hypothetical protein VZ94_10420 [Methylocucumis oryzae]
MQAITIAIGKTGINFFAQQLVAKELVNLLSQLRPPNKTINIGRIDILYSTADNIVINLTNGTLVNFTPAFESVTQNSGGNFPLVMQAVNFNAQYAWEETYSYTHCTFIAGVGVICDNPVNKDNKFTYTPSFSSLTVNVPLQFEYDNQSQTWSIVAGTTTGNAVSSSANIPSDSIIQEENQECFSSHASDATASALSAIDFSSSLNTLITGNLASIPASGNLGDGMVYDFSLGDSGLLFPNNDGIQMGVKGGASYNGTAFSGANPPSLPLPIPPADSDTSHHLNMYVSNYEVDALNWVYFEAGKLNLLIKPEDLPDAQLLKVSSYTTYEPRFSPMLPLSCMRKSRKTPHQPPHSKLFIYSTRP